MPERELTFAQAVREALAEEMRRDSHVCIFGEDVAKSFLDWSKSSARGA